MARATCTQPDCTSPISGRGLCSKHYQRFRYRGVLDEVAPVSSVKECAHCGTVFGPSERQWRAIYCSRRCGDNARSRREREQKGRRATTCAMCGKSLADKRMDAVFCSGRCGQNWRNEQTARKLLAKKAAVGRTCAGCGAEVPAARKGNALYCSTKCKIRSRRHEAYGLTKEELDLLLAQHAVCAICRSEDWGSKGPQVDHCHTTGKVRGILCINCNNGLGRFGDDPERLRRAAAYLEG